MCQLALRCPAPRLAAAGRGEIHPFTLGKNQANEEMPPKPSLLGGYRTKVRIGKKGGYRPGANSPGVRKKAPNTPRTKEKRAAGQRPTAPCPSCFQKPRPENPWTLRLHNRQPSSSERKRGSIPWLERPFTLHVPPEPISMESLFTGLDKEKTPRFDQNSGSAEVMTFPNLALTCFRITVTLRGSVRLLC